MDTWKPSDSNEISPVRPTGQWRINFPFRDLQREGEKIEGEGIQMSLMKKHRSKLLQSKRNEEEKRRESKNKNTKESTFTCTDNSLDLFWIFCWIQVALWHPALAFLVPSSAAGPI